MDTIEKGIIDCKICNDTPKNAIECVQCGHLFCFECIIAWYNFSKCYNCPYKCVFGSLRQVSGNLKRVLESYISLKQGPRDTEYEEMDIVKDIKINWKDFLERRDKTWMNIIKGYLKNARNIR